MKINNIKLKLSLSIILLFSIFGISYSSYLIPSAISNPQLGQVLVYDGALWSNAFPSVILMFLDDTAIIPVGAGPQTLSLLTLLNTPAGGATHTDTVTGLTSGTSPVHFDQYLYNTALNGTKITGGTWEFDTYCSVSATGGGATQILIGIYQVITGTNTVTITGSGTSRDALILIDTPFVSGDANANMSLSGYLTTPNGNFQITGYTANNEVTIATLSTYTNETTAAYTLHRQLFNTTTGTIPSTSISLVSAFTTQPAFNLSVTDKLAVRYFATTARSGSTTVNMTHNGTTEYSHFHMPQVIP